MTPEALVALFGASFLNNAEKYHENLQVKRTYIEEKAKLCFAYVCEGGKRHWLMAHQRDLSFLEVLFIYIFRKKRSHWKITKGKNTCSKARLLTRIQVTLRQPQSFSREENELTSEKIEHLSNIERQDSRDHRTVQNRVFWTFARWSERAR